MEDETIKKLAWKRLHSNVAYLLVVGFEETLSPTCVSVCVFCPSSYSLSGRKASSRNTSSRCTIVGLREAFGPLSEVMAKLVSARSFLASRLLCSGWYLQPQTAPRSTCSEDGERREETPGPSGVLSVPSPQLRASSFYDIINGFPLRYFSDVCSIKAREKERERGKCG